MKKKFFSFVAVIFFLLIAELLCAIALCFAEGNWIYTNDKNQNYELFEPHPRLIGVPRKNISVTINGIHYRHNSMGFRGDEIELEKTKKRIICMGGSTTYGIGVSNNETWVYYLDSLLSPEYEVLNLGIPGHTTAEHKKLLHAAIEKYEPDILLLHCGLNDMRNMHVQNIGNDYAHFHQPSLYASFGFCLQDRLPRIALVRIVISVLQKTALLPECVFRNEAPAGTLSDAVDERVVSMFSKNLDTLIAQCAAKNIPVLLLPQILTEDAVTEKNLKWWIPYLTKKGIFNALSTMNAAMKSAANTRHVTFISLAENSPWSNADFYDASHLNAKGNLKLAEIAAGYFAADTMLNQ